MANVKVKTTAVINNNPVGSTIEISKSSAEKLSAKGYVVIVEEAKAVKKASAPKKPTKVTPKKKATDKKDDK